MKGCRALSGLEAAQVAGGLAGRWALRDRALLQLGLRTGYRVSELLSLKVGDVWKLGQVADRVTVARRNRKGKPCGHTVIVNQAARDALAVWIGALADAGELDPAGHLFRSQKGSGKAITRRQALRVLRAGFDQAGLTGPLGTHSLRKTFAKAVYQASGHDLLKVQKLLGHAFLTTTQAYLVTDQAELDAVVNSI
jgi:site-specific recombinase XerD